MSSSIVETPANTSVVLLESPAVPSVVRPEDGRLRKLWAEKGPLCVLTLQGLNYAVDFLAIMTLIEGYSEGATGKVNTAAITALVNGVTLMPASNVSSALMRYPSGESSGLYIRRYNAAKVISIAHALLKIAAFLPCSYLVLLTQGKNKDSSPEAAFHIYLLMAAAMTTYACFGVAGGINIYRRGWERLC